MLPGPPCISCPDSIARKNRQLSPVGPSRVRRCYHLLHRYFGTFQLYPTPIKDPAFRHGADLLGSYSPLTLHISLAQTIMSIDTVPSTLPPPQLAAALVQSAVAKHRTRVDVLFFKAVSLFSHLEARLLRSIFPVHGRCHAVLWWSAFADSQWRLRWTEER
ncbi:hypothetical protein BDV98DRAFT_355318 [Pterulicium gracile]|uniref:Uncharacterized protein n=1 Tax=Pterulicium gracile TaxID=1884261 RepID=A0A5C3QRJ1_9AGAR|nr:hypothetical protein BDV98DRAFT_355318 [Pterula gracilis]